MTFRFVLLVLSPLVLAKINVHFSGEFKPNIADIKVDHYGIESAIITEAEKQTFNLNDNNLKWAVQLHDGKYPTDVFLYSPTPWGDLYKKYGWDQVKTRLRPRNGKILKILYEPDIILQQVFENNSSIPQTFNAGLSQEVKNTVSSSWYAEGDLSIDAMISYDIKFYIEAGEEVSFSYSSYWCSPTEKSQSVAVGATSSIKIILQPRQSVVAQLLVTKVNVKIQIEYEASLYGHVAANYYYKYKNHHFIPYDIEACMKSGGISNKKMIWETIDIGFYVDSKVVIHN